MEERAGHTARASGHRSSEPEAIDARVDVVVKIGGGLLSNPRQLDPVLSGKGQQLETGVPLSFFIAKGNRIYVAATAISRIKVTIQPLPWLEQFAGLLGLLVSKPR